MDGDIAPRQNPPLARIALLLVRGAASERARDGLHPTS
jgi:hypothetical protein